jgi:sugar lactone lactonase YvrE
LLFSDINAGTVSMLTAGGSVERLASGLSAPEGIVVQGDGRILVAEQGKNRIIAIDPQSHAVSQWRAFANRTGREGIDGIGPILPARDTTGNLLPDGNDVIIPDSPNGVVWKVTADGKTATQIASGMTRPAGAGIDARGRIFVADEGGALWFLDPAKHRFASLPTPDDVLVAKDGHIFVNTLGDNAIHELDVQGQQIGVLSRIQQPQGIALDGADNLYYTEFTAGRIARVIRTFSLDPPKVSHLRSDTFLICPSIRRASTFKEPLQILPPNAPVATLRVTQPGTDTSGALEVQTTEHSFTITVSNGGLLNLAQTVTVP